MKHNDYNPLNEGYTGRPPEKKGYTGSESSFSKPPDTIQNLQSGVVKPDSNQTTTSKTDKNKK